MSTPAYTVGQRVIVRGSFGVDAPEAVTILGFDEKNGRPLFDYVDKNGDNRWAYLAQIVRAA